MYRESEQVVGEVLERTGRRDDGAARHQGRPAAGEGEPGQWHRREHIVASCDASLRNLRTDRIDLYQLHRPSDVVPLEETLGVLGELVAAGKVRWIGTSTFAAWMIADAHALAREQACRWWRANSRRTTCSIDGPRTSCFPMCEHYGVAVVPWSPLAGGVLAGRYDRLDVVPEDSRRRWCPMTRDRMNERRARGGRGAGELARERGLTTSQLALLWAKDQPGVTAPIIGPRTLAQLDDALGVLDLALDDDARAACDALVHPGNAVSDFYSTAFWMRAEV